MAAKRWLQNSRSDGGRWMCYECQYPPCTKCNAVPVHAVGHSGKVDGKYYCVDCRYPPCRCGARRNEGHYDTRYRFMPYTCPTCCAKEAAEKQTQTCERCGGDKDIAEYVMVNQTRRHTICASCRASCRAEQEETGRRCKTCDRVLHVQCFKQDRWKKYHVNCLECEALQKCEACGRKKRLTLFMKTDKMKHHTVCIECEHEQTKEQPSGSATALRATTTSR